MGRTAERDLESSTDSASRCRRSVTLKLSSSAILSPQGAATLLARAIAIEASTQPQSLQGRDGPVYNGRALPGPPMADSAGTLFESLLSIMSRLRSEGGCPWDREQTPRVAQALSDRGSLRGPGGPRLGGARPRPGGAGRSPVPGGVPRPARPGVRRVHHGRSPRPAQREDDPPAPTRVRGRPGRRRRRGSLPVGADQAGRGQAGRAVPVGPRWRARLAPRTPCGRSGSR